jgi:hypothetical protein
MRLRSASLWAGLWYAFIAAGVTGPWFFNKGYVFLLDSVWGPHIRVAWHQPTMNLGWQIVSAISSAIIGSALTEKLLLSALLWACGLSAYYLARKLLSPLWAWAAGSIYLLNPFVYERLLGGQWIVLAGYALLPAALALAWQTLAHHGTRYAHRLAAILALYPLVSPHFAYINGWITAALVCLYALVERPHWLWRRRTLLWLGALIAAVVVANWFWLASPTGRQFQAFNAIDFATFRTASDPAVGLWGNVLGLYGFWHGSAFIEPKNFLGPAWLIVAGLMLMLALTGAVRAVRDRSPLALTLAAAVPIATVLAVGYASSAIRPLTVFLLHYLPGYRGLRDSAKLVAVLALAYGLLVPYGAAWLSGYWKRRYTRILAAGFLTFLAAMSVTGIWVSASHQIPVTDYPPGWYAVKARLRTDPTATVAVLPWHDHLRLSFAGNNYVGQPAPVFLANTTLQAGEDDNILAARPSTPADHLMLDLLLDRIMPARWAVELRHLGVKYVLLEKTDDWASYAPKIQAAGLNLVFQDSSVELYRL